MSLISASSAYVFVGSFSFCAVSFETSFCLLRVRAAPPLRTPGPPRSCSLLMSPQLRAEKPRILALGLRPLISFRFGKRFSAWNKDKTVILSEAKNLFNMLIRLWLEILRYAQDDDICTFFWCQQAFPQQELIMSQHAS